MKIYFFWPEKNKIPSSNDTEPFEFYTTLKKMENITLVNSFKEADFIFYMMDLYVCYNRRDVSSLDINDLNNLKNHKNHKNYEKDVIIDYSDHRDICPGCELKSIGRFYKRSVIKKVNHRSSKLIEYPREIIPISYGIRSDFINYDKKYKFTNYKYNICCLFNTHKWRHWPTCLRYIIPSIINSYKGSKFVGRINCPDSCVCNQWPQEQKQKYPNGCPYRYGQVNTNYYEILKTSKIIVTANPPHCEGDFRLWEALLMGNLVLVDKMILPPLMKYPLINKKHLVFYHSIKELKNLISYYLANDEERIKIGKEGREYCLKHHKFSDRVKEVVDSLN